MQQKATPRIGAAIYARKSTESEDRQILSIDSQVHELTELARKREINVKHILTEAKSAKAPGRPVFEKLLALVKKGQVTEILTWKLDRMARNPVDGGALIWAMEQESLQQIHTPQNTFSNSGNDKFWMQMEFGMASKFIYDLRDNTKRGLRAKYEQGWYPCRAPVGYLNDVLTHTIVKDSKRFPVVRRMWDHMLSGSYTSAQIQHLSEHKWGLRTQQTRRQGGKPLTVSAVYRMFHNPFYCGILTLNGESFQAAHDPMVSKSEFDQVRTLLGAAEKPRHQKHTFAFTGLIRCGNCGCVITASHTVNRHGTHYEYYRCTRRKKYIGCTQKAIRREELERQFASFLSSLTLPRPFGEFALKMLRQTYEDEKAVDRKSIRALNQRHEAVKRELSRLIDLKLRELLTEAEFVDKKRDLIEEQARISEVLRDAEHQFKSALRQAEDTINLAAGLKQKFSTGDNQAKREIVVATCCNPSLLYKKLSITPKEPFSLIQRRVSALDRKTTRLQPDIRCEGKAKSGLSDAAVVTMGGLVKDLQTFFLNHHSEYHIFHR